VAARSILAPVAEDLEYIKSERFIHDDLAKRCGIIAEEVRDTWRKEFALDSYAISWPSETVKDDAGIGITDVVLMPIPERFSQTEVSDALRRMVKRTKAYGIALIERRGNELRVLFETHHGARAWLMKLERHGDVLVPGETQVHDNVECLGLLWQAHRGTS
jgi:hypothetical protein